MSPPSPPFLSAGGGLYRMLNLVGRKYATPYGDDFPVPKKARDRLRRILSGMYRRCYIPKTIGFAYWGGRGIKICPEWFNEETGLLNYRNFFLWAYENGYRADYQIDRIDNNKGYSPSNCRWVTSSQNNRNKRNNKILNFRGEELCQKEMAEKYGMDVFSLHNRLFNGWTLERALLEPIAPSERLITYNGETHNLAEWGRILGIGGDTIKDRLSCGWSVERTLSTPLGLGGRSRLIEYRGEKKTIKEWAKETPLKYRTFLNRLATGWSMEEIFSTPLKSPHDKRIRRKESRARC